MQNPHSSSVAVTSASSLCVVTLTLLIALPGRAHEPTRPDGVELADVVDVVVLDDELIAIDAFGGVVGVTRPILGEEVLWSGAQGQVGLVLTDRRALAVASGTGGWRSIDYFIYETPAEEALLADRVALVVTDQRIIGFDAERGHWTERRLELEEAPLEAQVGVGVGAVVTSHRVLALSAGAGTFREVDLLGREVLESLSARGDLATVTTSSRLLVYRAEGDVWAARRRHFR